MKSALLVGAGSGLGLAAAQALAQKDFTVFALDINTDNLQNRANIVPIKCDVTKTETLQTAQEEILQYTDKIELLSYFPGVVVLGSLVETDPLQMQRIFDINLFGMYRVVHRFFPLVQRGGGRIVNISSEYGMLDSLPFHSFYTASKHAVEVYMDGLRRELMFRDIKVVTIRPGAFQTAMQGGVTAQFDTLVQQTESYKNTLLKMQSLMLKELKHAKNPQKFVKVYLKAALKKHPKIYYKVGNSAKMKLLNILSPKMQDVVLKVFFRTKKSR